MIQLWHFLPQPGSPAFSNNCLRVWNHVCVHLHELLAVFYSSCCILWPAATTGRPPGECNLSDRLLFSRIWQRKSLDSIQPPKSWFYSRRRHSQSVFLRQDEAYTLRENTVSKQVNSYCARAANSVTHLAWNENIRRVLFSDSTYRLDLTQEVWRMLGNGFFWMVSVTEACSDSEPQQQDKTTSMTSWIL